MAPARSAYLDHAATTPLRPAARAAMDPWLGASFGNPSGAHGSARRARRAVDDARDVFAAATGFAPGDVIFTGGGTEADNLAIAGVVAVVGGVPACSAVEHHAVLRPVEAAGGHVIATDTAGRVDLDALDRTLRQAEDGNAPPVTVVSIMAVNNETGVVNDLAAVAEVVRSAAPDAVLHADAIQAMCWRDLSGLAEIVDACSLSAHKFGGPQGVGVLAVGPDVTLAARTLGGGQERGRRAGSQNVAGIVGAAAAADVVCAERAAEAARVDQQRTRLRDGVLATVDGVVATVDPTVVDVVPGTVHLCIPGVSAEALLLLLEDRGVEASAASSCASGAQQASHVLAAMGIDEETARGSMRLSLGWSTTDDDIDLALEAIPAAVERARLFAP